MEVPFWDCFRQAFDQSWCFVKTGRQAVGLFGWIFVGVLKSRVRDFCVPTYVLVDR